MTWYQLYCKAYYVGVALQLQDLHGVDDDTNAPMVKEQVRTSELRIKKLGRRDY